MADRLVKGGTPGGEGERWEVVVPAAAEVCFAVLRDVGTYARWWTLAEIEAPRGGSRLVTGATFRVRATVGPWGVLAWTGRVVAAHAPHRLDLWYDGGDLAGGVAWELDARAEETLVTHTTAGLRSGPGADGAVHAYAALVVGAALPGLARLLGGGGDTLTDVAWRATCLERISELAAPAGLAAR